MLGVGPSGTAARAGAVSPGAAGPLLARGRHTLRIVAQPDANLLATGRRLSLDALHVAPLDGRPRRSVRKPNHSGAAHMKPIRREQSRRAIAVMMFQTACICAPASAGRAQDTLLERRALQYAQATTRDDSLRYGDSVLAAARAILGRDSLALVKAYGRGRHSESEIHTLRAVLGAAAAVRDWSTVLASGQALFEARGIPPHNPKDGPDSFLADPDTRNWCTVLLTAYMVTKQPARADSFITRITRRFHLHGEMALWGWYVTGLVGQFGFDMNMVNDLMQQYPYTTTMHYGLIPHAAVLTAVFTRNGTEQQRLEALLQSRVGPLAHPALPLPAPTPKPAVWPSEPPPDNPFPPSHTITGIEFSGTYAYPQNLAEVSADTWYPSWGADNKMYSSFADGGLWDPAGLHYYIAGGGEGQSGRAIIEGDDPTNLTVTPLQTVNAPGTPYAGRYPSASLMYHGVWYVGTYTLDDLVAPACGNWCVLGPFVGFHWSADHGRTWHASPASVTPDHPLFGETARDSARVKLSAAHFVDFGKDMRYSPDGKAYLVGHGATAPHSHNNWIAGDQIYLARVTPSPETINDVRAWEFYAGRDAQGQPRWSHDFGDIKPILAWDDHLGNVAVTYDAPLQKYLLFTTHAWPSVDAPYDTIVLEADQLTGPWRLVSYMRHFGPEAYFVNLPSKFISKDGRTAWLCYSTSILSKSGPFNPPGGEYSMTLHKIRLVGPRPRPAGH